MNTTPAEPEGNRTAFVTGITGQDGSYLAELLLGKGYEVHGLVRRSSSLNTSRIEHLYKDCHDPSSKLHLHYGDLEDPLSLRRALEIAQPHEVYNLGAQSHVRVSFDNPLYTADATGLGALRLLEAVKDVCSPKVRYYQAGSSEMFGSAAPPQTEATPFHPRSPYACAKVFAHYATINYRESCGLFASNGMLFNHASPRRGDTFVTQKIAKAVAAIEVGAQEFLYLGNLDAKRDWGYAPDYVEAMWLMLQHDAPGDYVVATGETHSVREFVEAAFSIVGLDWQKYVRIDPRFYRPAEVDALCGDSSKARTVLGWTPKTTFSQLVGIMVAHARIGQKCPAPADLLFPEGIPAEATHGRSCPAVHQH